MANVAGRPSEVGLYFHIPFCASKCPYCDFNSYIYNPVIAQDCLEALKAEVLHRGRALGRPKLSSVYFGGGTPTTMAAAELAHLLRLTGEAFDAHGQLERTVEANPGGLGPGYFQDLVLAGFNRISLGVQSLDDSVLKSLGRGHCAAEALKSYAAAREEGFSNLSVDLIYAAPGQSLDSWEATLEKVMALEPEHISIYELTVEEATVFSAMARRGQLKPQDEDVALKMYDAAIDKLHSAGFEHYEISNFARSGRRSRHNQIYWKYEDYIGLGPGAHSKMGRKRFWNEPNPLRYAQLAAEGGCAAAGEEELSAEKAFAEALMLGLRMIEGVDLARLGAIFGVDPDLAHGDKLSALEADGLIQRDGARLKLTRMGIYLSNEVFAEFF